jgi:hypothetical protein
MFIMWVGAHLVARLGDVHSRTGLVSHGTFEEILPTHIRKFIVPWTFMKKHHLKPKHPVNFFETGAC